MDANIETLEKAALDEIAQAADQNAMMQSAIDEMKQVDPNFNPEWQKESLVESGLQGFLVSQAHQASRPAPVVHDVSNTVSPGFTLSAWRFMVSRSQPV